MPRRAPSAVRPAPERAAAEPSEAELALALERGLDALGLDLDAPARSRLLAYLVLIRRWNSTFNLTAIRRIGAMLELHVLDSLSLVPGLEPWLPAGATLVDVGSGAGLPGIPVAIARPDLRVHLVEPVGKKAAFLRQCQAELPLPGVFVHDCRIEQLALSAPPEAIVSRAFASLADFARSVMGIAGPATRLLAMKGARPDDELHELAAVEPAWRVRAIEALTVPGLDAQRCVVVLEPAEAAFRSIPI